MWAPKFRKDMDGLEGAKTKATRLVWGQEFKSCEQGLRVLGMFILEKRSLRGYLITL